MSFFVFVLLTIAVAAAAFVQGSVGIGFALIMAPIFALVDAQYLPVTLLILMLPLNFLVAWREREAIDFSGAKWITVGRFVGTFIGMAVLVAITVRQLEIAVGVFTVLAAIVALVAPPFSPARTSSMGVGLFTGVTETATGIGGPPLALLYQHAPGPVLRSTVAVCFLVGEIISLAVLAIADQVRSDQLLAAAYLVPAVFFGSALSRLAHARLNGGAVRLAVLVFSIASGLFLVLKG
ncbi:sulfite exporter TauE/SafE family protein [Devosia sp. YIM 151766]|uniref:sulfite exporter TauE/SafE family protein n=1 Tax=Devosia sp. YIM 151766 TaxID=3017325 RepID=UPI00255CB015|nr:sulfite exporter TauE/SafE family protein [Devosia sp. YIM 151766]WIY53864.1 sulfite exporter TauE/SafE family protein [Devosia sp. YIM 151766]